LRPIEEKPILHIASRLAESSNRARTFVNRKNRAVVYAARFCVAARLQVPKRLTRPVIALENVTDRARIVEVLEVMSKERE
jgi:hypothetical protein